MGVCFHKIDGDGPPMKKSNKPKNIDTGFVWVICRREPQKEGPAKWHIQGIMYYEQDAVDSCLDENYFVGPLPVNTALPHKLIEWVGAYFPLAKKE